MNKAQLVEAVAERTGLVKGDADRAVSAALDVVTEQLAEGDKVQLAGFGAFSTKHREARTGTRPGTGEPMEIAAATVVKFAAASGLKASLNK